MPLVEFECEDCSKIEEVLILTTEDKKWFLEEYEKHIMLCNKCSGKLKRVLSVTGKGIVKQ